MIPENIEHFEAQQLQDNEFRNNFTKSLSENDQEKFKKVEEAIQILRDNKIPFFLFTYLPTMYKSQGFWQWNNVQDFLKLDKNGKYLNHENTLLFKLNASFVYAVYVLLCKIFRLSDKAPQEQMICLFKIIEYCLSKSNEWLSNGE